MTDLQHYIDGLREIVAADEIMLEQLQREVVVVRSRVVRVNRAIRDLTGEPAPAPEKKPKPKAKARNKRPNDQILAGITGALARNNGDGMTTAEIAEVTGAHPTTVREGLRALREDERVRLAGIRPRDEGSPGRGSQVFKLMPNSTSNGG